VQITYTALVATVALASALAFGLGGREVAGTMLNDAYRKGREQRGQVRSDMETGKRRGQEHAERGKQRAQAEVGADRQPGNGGQGGPSGAYRAEG
jgi:hypothetical protein